LPPVGRPESADAGGVVILGGTAGVGLEAGVQFADNGARVALLGRDEERGAAACHVCRERVPGADVHFIAVDAGGPAAARKAEEAARAQLGAIDVLVNATSPGWLPRLLHLTPLEDTQPVVNEFLLPPLHMTQAVLPAMRARRRGSIVTVASDAAKVPTPGEALIGAAMAAIVMFMRTAALEAKRDGVRVNVLTPSLIAGTPGQDRIDGDPFCTRLFATAAARADLGVPDPEDLVALILFLAGPAARRITGQVISVNGGISI
jgi:NAD(P)-dependent dehydrogenase (short-subunit alcohol dehydrogenase family)